MTSDEYKEVAEELDSLLRVYPIVDDPRLLNPIMECITTARTRHEDLKKKGKR